MGLLHYFSWWVLHWLLPGWGVCAAIGSHSPGGWETSPQAPFVPRSVDLLEGKTALTIL